jgi:phosphoribosyl-dephospho-CoA transferase
MVDHWHQLPRHQMVWVEPSAWPIVLAQHEPLDADPLINMWAGNGWPLVVRSRGCDEAAHLLALGIPLPPSHGKKRCAFRVDADLVIRTEGPPLVALATAVAPPSWRDSISSITRLDAGTRCFGSLGWEYLTGLSYLTPESDLDLLWDVASEAEADQLARDIARIDNQSPMRIDGEFVALSGGIQWREWHSNVPAVMAKTLVGPRLLPREQAFT